MRHHIYMKYFSIIHRFSIIFHIRKLKAFHLSGHQMGYVSCICNHPGTSQEQMASYLGLNKGAVAKGIRPLLKEGYIRRVQNEKDRRAYRLYPTEKSRELYAAAEAASEEFFQILTKGMSAEESEIFQSLLSRACDNVVEAAGEDRRKLTHPGHSAGECGCSHPADVQEFVDSMTQKGEI